MLRHMDYITSATDPENSGASTINFVRDLFDVVRYTNVIQKREMMLRLKLHYLASQGGHLHYARLYCHSSSVVKVDRQSRGFDPEPRLISDTIAAFP